MNSLPNLIDLFRTWEETSPDKPFLKEPVSGKYRTFTWRQAGHEIRKMAGYLQSLELPEKSHIAILGKNSAHWIMADLAIMMAGYVTIPLYPNLTFDQLGLILEHSESRLLFLGKLDNLDELKRGIPESIKCISFPFYPHAGYLTWDEATKDQLAGDFPLRKNDELSCIMYTSGTTGKPKGVMHTFGGFAFALDGISKVLNFENETFFSYLPLCHVAEKIVTESAGLLTGGQIYFAESLETFSRDLKTARPTVFLAVPRIWTKFQEGILAKMPQKRLDFLLSIPWIKSIVKKSIRKKLGLSRARIILSGAAPIAPALLKWFDNIGIPIMEAYGMTENLAYSTVNRPQNIKIGSVGQIMPDCEIKLSEEGEILAKSNATMVGYFKDPEQTAEVIVDGFLRTGDEGRIDEEGFLFITGRSKDIFKTSKGKYISPGPIEKVIMEHAFVSQVCVVGPNLPQPIALITVPSGRVEISEEKMMAHFSSVLKKINENLAAHEQLRKIILFLNEWTVGDILTPSLKIKRKNVEEIYGPSFETWYASDEKVIFG